MCSRIAGVHVGGATGAAVLDNTNMVNRVTKLVTGHQKEHLTPFGEN